MSNYSPDRADLEELPIPAAWRELADGVLPGNREQLAEQLADVPALFFGFDEALGLDVTAWKIRWLAGQPVAFSGPFRRLVAVTGL